FRSNAYAGILHRETYSHFIVFTLEELSPKLDGSLICKLEAIGNEIGKDLLQTKGVKPHIFRDIGSYVDYKVNFLFIILYPKQIFNIPHQVRQVEILILDTHHGRIDF